MIKKFKMRHFEKIVSIFVILAIFFLTTMIIFLTKQKKVFATKLSYYTIIDSAQKISIGQEIILKGPNVPIGKIENFSITQDNRVRVDFFIYKEFQPKVRLDSVIIFTPPMLGILGGLTIEVTTGDSYYPIIPTDNLIPSNRMNEGLFLLTLKGIDKEKQELPIIDKLNPLLDNLTKVLDPNGPTIKNVTSLLYHFNVFAMQLNQGGVFSILGSPALRANIERMTDQINVLLKSSDTLLNSKVKDIMGEVSLLLGDLKKSTETVNYNLPKMLSKLNIIMFRLDNMMKGLEGSPLFSSGYNKAQGRGDSKKYFEGP